jgi:hypothetical protein
MAERLTRWLRRRVLDPLQLPLLDLVGLGAPAPPAPAALPPPGALPAPAPPAGTDAPRRSRPAADRTLATLRRLEAHGLRGIGTLRLRRTRRVMVSVAADRLTLHTDFADAPDEVLRAVVRFVMARRRADRLAAQRVILAYEVARPPAARRPEPPRAGDELLVARLRDAHRALNQRHFGGTLAEVPLRVSGRMRRRLGQYTPRQPDHPVAEIALSRAHIRRHGWDEALHTLLHEMVHQWQDEQGLPVDHGLAFRRKAREVGVLPRARRPLDPASLR